MSNLPTLPHFLQSHVTDVVSVTDADHGAGQTPDAWRERFPQCGPVLALAERFGAKSLTRHDLFQLGAAAPGCWNSGSGTSRRNIHFWQPRSQLSRARDKDARLAQCGEGHR